MIVWAGVSPRGARGASRHPQKTAGPPTAPFSARPYVGNSLNKRAHKREEDKSFVLCHFVCPSSFDTVTPSPPLRPCTVLFLMCHPNIFSGPQMATSGLQLLPVCWCTNRHKSAHQITPKSP